MNYTIAIEILLISIVGYVFTQVLIVPGMIFDRYGKFLEFKVKPKNEKLSDLLGLCVYCFTGQLALWYYFFKYSLGLDITNSLFIIAFISSAIFLIKIFIKKWKL